MSQRWLAVGLRSRIQGSWELAYILLNEVTITHIIVWPEAKLQGREIALPISRKLD